MQVKICGNTKFRIVFKCECGNHMSFSGIEKIPNSSRYKINYDYCGKIQNMKFVYSRMVVEN